MADYSDITTLSLGNTFGAWYAKTNEIITRLNTLDVGSITGGDGILATKHPSIAGGYTLDLSGTVAKAMTFQNNVTIGGNLTVNGVLNYSFGGADTVSGINVEIPANTGVTIGNIVYIDSDGKAQKALADDECTSEAIGIVVGFTGGNAQVATSGKISGSGLIQNFLGGAGSLQKGVVYFLSSGVSGAGTTMEPDVTENISKPVLIGLTADSGIILPYRGYVGAITGSFGGPTTVVQGVCGGVLSFNGPNGSLYASEEDADNAIVKTTGDVIGISHILDNDSNAFLTSYIFKGNFPPGVNSYQFSGSSMTFDVQPGQFIKLVQTPTTTTSFKLTKLSNYSNVKTLFSTSGITSDVWRLKNIKVNATLIGQRPTSFLLIRSINRTSGTNYINHLGHCAGAVESPNNGRLIYGLNSVFLEYEGSISPTTYTPISAPMILTPRIIQPKVTFSGTPATGDGATAAVLYTSSNEPVNTSSGPLRLDTGTLTNCVKVEANSSGQFPVIYGGDNHTIVCSFSSSDKPRAVNNRNYTWDFNKTIVGGSTGAYISEYLYGAYNGTDLDLTSGAGVAAGITLDTSLLGWCPYYNAMSESLDILIVNGNYYSPAESNPENHSKVLTVFLELAKYDINTKQETSSVIITTEIDQIYSLQFEEGGTVRFV
jgi:hypothetical protein